MKVSLAFHLIGIIFWAGSLLVLTRLLSAASVEPLSPAISALMRRSYFGFTIAGLVIAAATGIFQIFQSGLDVYMKQGWFHGKLTFLLLLVGVTVAVGLQISKINAGGIVSRKAAGMLHGLTSLAIVAVILLTMLGR